MPDLNMRTIFMKFEKFIFDTRIDDEVLDTICPNGCIIPQETVYWDYKRDLPKPKDRLAQASFAKSVMSFYNTYGGYLFYGIEEKIKDLQWELVGINLTANRTVVQVMKGAVDKYVGESIVFSPNILRYFDKDILLVHIPKRPVGVFPVPMSANSPTVDDEQIFTERHTFFRKEDECERALTHSEFSFLAGPRINLTLMTASPPPSSAIQNLPDRAFICTNFVGRDEILKRLWEWISSGMYKEIALVGAGGRGKTSIAYQFATEVLDKSDFDMVWWLSAKEMQFDATTGEYRSLPYQDLENAWFSTRKELLVQLADLLVPNIKEFIYDKNNEEQITRILVRELRLQLANNKIFLIIDDVDSCLPDEQRKILDTITAISGDTSRVLVTTRQMNAWSSDRCIAIPGFTKEELVEFVQVIQDRFDISIDINNNTLDKYLDATDGSPLFLESIFRLVKMGSPADRALEQWKGHRGEDVRIAALKREICQLSERAKKVLLAASCLGNSSLEEIEMITIFGHHTALDSINEIVSLHLLDAPRIIESVPRYHVSDPVAKFVISTAEKTMPEYSTYTKKVREFREDVRFKRSNERKLMVRQATLQCKALLDKGRIVDALSTIDTLLGKKQYEKDPSLILLKVKILVGPNSDGGRVNEGLQYLRKIYEERNRSEVDERTKNEILELMYDAKFRLGDPQGALSVCDDALRPLERISRDEEASKEYASWAHKKARAAMELVRSQSRPRELGRCLEEVAESLAVAVNESSDTQEQYSTALNYLHDTILNEARDYLAKAEAALRAIRRGDYRNSIFEGLISAVAEQVRDTSPERLVGTKLGRERAEKIMKFTEEINREVQFRESTKIGPLESFRNLSGRIKEVVGRISGQTIGVSTQYRP